MQDYYQKLLDRVNDLIEKKDYQQANQLVDEELSMPYIPLDVNENLLALKDELKYYLNIEKPLKFVEPEQLVEYLKKDQQNAYLALNTLDKCNIRNYLKEIQDAFDDMEISRSLKSIILELLVRQQINSEFKLNDEMINPSQIEILLTQEYVNEAFAMLDKLINDNPTFLQQCQFVYIGTAYQYYPKQFNIQDLEYICYKVIKYVYYAYQQEQQWQQFVLDHQIDEKKLEELTYECYS